MTDFTKALTDGFEAAKRAGLARAEINQVFAELKGEVLKATEDKVVVERVKLAKQILLDYPAHILGGVLPQHKKVQYWAIAAYNQAMKQKTYHELAEWEGSDTGFPCKVSWNGKVINCFDGEGLANCLLSLLADAVVGEAILGAMNEHD